MQPLFAIDKHACIKCFACVRVCPVKAIEVTADRPYAAILPHRCVGCGSCLTICPVSAISYRSSKQEVKALLAGGHQVVAIVDPSISGEFVDILNYRKFVQMIKALGFKRVCEVTFGVDLIAREYKRLFDGFRGKYFITTVCPVVVSMVERFFPEQVTNLIPLVSPMVATAMVVRQEYGEPVKVVHIGPCIQAKDEALRYQGAARVDAVLTFVELRELFQEFNVKESDVEFSEFDEPIGYRGSLLPISNGVLQAVNINEDLLTGTIITAEGRDKVLNALEQLMGSIETIARHFNLFYCHGCLMGPGTSRGGQKYIRRTMVVNYANKRLKTFRQNPWEEAVGRHSALDFSCQFTPNDQRLPTPPRHLVQEVIRRVGKEAMGPESGCEACGYLSCHDFAKAVASGVAHIDMCLNYSLRNQQESAKTLRATTQQLAQLEEALRETDRLLKAEQEAAHSASDTMSTMMRKFPSAVLILDRKLRLVQSNQAFIDLLGDEAREIHEVIPGLIGADLNTLLPRSICNLFSYVLHNDEDIQNRDVLYQETLLNVSVFTIKRNTLVGAVIRDMYAPEVRKEEVIKRVTEAIDKNLAMVQKIGFLLGEGASEIEQMLNSIIKAYKEGKGVE